MSSPIEIRTVSSRRDLKAFVRFPWRVYKNDPLWVPPLITDRLKYLDPAKGPYYAQADITLLMASRDGEVLGTLADWLALKLGAVYGCAGDGRISSAARVDYAEAAAAYQAYLTGRPGVIDAGGPRDQQHRLVPEIEADAARERRGARVAVRLRDPEPASVVDKNWIAAYQAVEYRNPETYSINGYSAMKALGEAVKKANSIEVKPVIDALHSINLTTPIGQIAYDASGDLKDQRIYIFQVQKDGDELKFVQVPQ